MKALLNIYKRAYSKGYLKYAIFAIVCIAIDIMVALFIPYISRIIIDEAIPNHDLNLVIRVGIIVISIAIASVFSTIFNNICAQYIATSVASDIRIEMFEKIQELSLSNVDKVTTGKLITVVTNDINQIQQIIVFSFRGIIRAPITLIGSLVMAYITNQNLFLTVIIGVVSLTIALVFVFKTAAPLFSKIQNRVDDLNTKLSETIGGAREVKAFVNEVSEEEKFNDVNEKYYKANLVANRVIVLVNPLVLLVSNILIGLVLYIASKLIMGGQSQLTGTVMTYVSYIQQIINSLMLISTISISISRAIVSSERYQMIMDVKVDVENSTEESRVIEGNIRFENVNFAYTEDDGTSEGITLNNINLDIKAGEMIGVIGSTGSGKSSLISLIPRLYDVTDGTLYIDDINIKGYNLKDLRNQISLVTQEAIIFSGTILDNIKQGNEMATIDEVNEAAALACALEFIDSMPEKYNTRITQGGTSLSGGQRQRISIARGLVRKPKVLILDDSTSAVDAKTEKKIKQNLRTITGTTKIIVAQKISSIIDCDRIIVLGNGGYIDGFDTHKELLKSSRVYKEIYASQYGGDVHEF